MNLRDVGLETNDNDSVQANKMIKKLYIKCRIPGDYVIVYMYTSRLAINTQIAV